MSAGPGCFDNASCLLSSYHKMNAPQHSPNTAATTTTSSSSVVEKQGIVSILNNSDFITPNSNNNNNNTYPIRIRRTLSADMSSQKWLQTNGMPHSALKRVKSSVQLQALGEEEDTTNDPAFDEIWSSIQADKTKTWGCILSPPQNDNDNDNGSQLPPAPYIHPLAKRTASSLSEKSLEICTESLGSETGSDGYSYPPSEPEDSEEEEEEEEEAAEHESEVKGYNNVQVGIYKYNHNNNRGPASKRSMMVPSGRASSFPPPLPSLAHRDDGSNLHIRSHRQDGRLVVEAVAVPSQNRFRAQRQDGRLLLTFSAHQQDEEVVDDDDEMDDQEEEEEEEEEQELGIGRGVVNVQRSYTALAMTKFMELTSGRNKSTWPRNYNKTVIKTLDEDQEQEEIEQVVSLPPRAAAMSTATAVAMNAYEYYWRRRSDNSAVAAMLKPFVGAQKNICAPAPAPQVGKDTTESRNDDKEVLYAAHNTKGAGALGQQEQVVIVKTAGRRRRGGGGGENAAEHLVPLMLRGCKEPKKPSLLLWEPYCIATS